jgi:hypothetical protein
VSVWDCLIDVNLRNQWFEDPLMLAVRGGHFSIVDALVANPSVVVANSASNGLVDAIVLR